VATFSTFLGLKINDDSDPFLLSDFALNWGILDGVPGVFPCTSGSKPSWGAAQAGRTIFMTDFRQFQWWNGSTWLDPETSVPAIQGGVTLNQAVAKNTSPVNQVVTLTLSRTCSLAIVMSGTYLCSNQQSQGVKQRIVMDGVDLIMGGYTEQLDFIGNSGEAAGTVGVSIPTLGISQGLTTGSHTISVKTLTGASNTTVTLLGAKVLAFVVDSNASNSF
jgi:hypothetical protein